ncbi:nonstructural protein 1 [Opossum tetraparvovirus]|uniref:Nonstructural protein 1 n=1 Tax=Opossum tetraparvovirus TaxID=2137540 RepID=A0A2Z3D6L3_9VIRU|nr:nonstructural protein 1 [Opossum tetraparvovirus]AVR53744.1 nonstructural protein 1 [Opossum tetraparvovirus]
MFQARDDPVHFTRMTALYGECWMAVLKLSHRALDPVQYGGTRLRGDVRLPPGSDWPVAELREAHPAFVVAVNVGDLVWSELLYMHNLTFPQYTQMSCFMQLEPCAPNENFVAHLHLVWVFGRVTPKDAGNYFKAWRSSMGRYLEGGIFPGNWEIKKTAQGRWYRGTDGFIDEYLIPKLPPKDVWWAWTTMPKYAEPLLNEPLRRQACGAIALPFSDSPTEGNREGGDQAPTMGGRAASRFLELIDWLVREGICSEIEWLRKDKQSYRTFMASSGGVLQVRNALTAAVRELTIDNRLLEFLSKGIQDEGLLDCIQKFLKANNLDLRTTAWYMAGWASGVWPKRRAIWLHGPPNTGKTVWASEIARLAPCFGSVAWTNENFTFNDCVCVPLIWWEEGRITEKIVEAAKCVLGGSPVRIDRKNRGSDEFVPAPVLITSNGDMTVTYDGPIVSKAHSEALRSRITRVPFTAVLAGEDVAAIKAAIPAFFQLGARLLAEHGPPPEANELPAKSSVSHPGSPDRGAAPQAEQWDSEEDWFPPTPTPPRRKKRKVARAIGDEDSDPDVRYWLRRAEWYRYSEWADQAIYVLCPILQRHRQDRPGLFYLYRATQTPISRRLSVGRSEAVLCRAFTALLDW